MSLRAVLLRTLLILVSGSISFLVAELAFRAYEDRFLLQVVEAGSGVYDLGALGYNDGRIEARRPPGAFRILSFGDSFTWSVVAFPHSWNGVLERTLSTPDRPVRVVNLGVSDRTFDGYLDQARFWTGQLEYDAVVFQVYAGNDFADAVGARRVHRALQGDVVRERFGRASETGDGGSPLVTGPGQRVPRRSWSRMIDYATALLWTWRTGAPREPEFLDTTQIPFERYVSAMSVASHPYWDRELSRHFVLPGYTDAVDLLRFAQGIAASGRRVTILVSPPAFFFQEDVRAAMGGLGVPVDRLDPFLPATTLAALAAEDAPDVEIVDPLACWLDDPASRELYYGTNTHWGLEGNRAVGLLLAAHVRSVWWGESSGDADCAIRVVAPPDPDTPRGRYARAIRQGTEIERRARDLLEGVRDTHFASHAAFEDRLVALGAAPAGSGARGRVERVQAREALAEEPPALVSGWFSDVASGDAPALVIALHAGRLTGWATTWGRHAGAPHDPAAGVAMEYRVPLMTDCASLATDGSLWLYGVGASGRFAPIEMPTGLACATP